MAGVCWNVEVAKRFGVQRRELTEISKKGVFWMYDKRYGAVSQEKS